MAMKHASLRKKIDELEAEVDNVLQDPAEHPSSSGLMVCVGTVHRKIGFVKKLLAAEMESGRRGGETEHLEEMADRLVSIEKNFVEWATFVAIDGHTSGPVSPCSCTSSCSSSKDEGEDEDVERCSKPLMLPTTEEMIRRELENMLSKANLEDAIMKLTERSVGGKETPQRSSSLFLKLGTVGVLAALAAIGFAIASFGSLEGPTCLVPT